MAKIDKVALYSSFARAAALTGISFTTTRYIPRPLKWLLVFLVALNIRNYPLAWHFRILTPWFKAVLRDKLAARRGGQASRLALYTRISPLGRNPLDVTEVWRSRAGIADCDYNGHLSNSSYAKNLDFVRMNAAVTFFPGFSGYGGMLALGGSYFNYVKEIPLNAEYEIHLRFGGWEANKWVYLVATFVSYPKSSSKSGTKPAAITVKEQEQRDAQSAAKDLLKDVVLAPPTTNIAESAVLVEPPSSHLLTPASSGINSPSPYPPTPVSQSISYPSALPVPEGATLHATAVSLYCFKHGRVTVPPRVAFIFSGFGKRERWDALLPQRTQPGRIKHLMRGGWAEESEGNFWDFEECEAVGRKRGDELKTLRGIMDGLSGR